MEGRVDKKSDDLFFTCSLIDRISRVYKRKRKDTVNLLGKDVIDRIYDLADVYHCENMEEVVEQFAEECKIGLGEFDNISSCEYRCPTYWELGKVYSRLIERVAEERGEDVISVLFEVYNSWISDSLDDYNSSMYYSNSGYIYYSYLEGYPLDD